MIPQEVKIKGTVRTLDPDVRDLAEKEFLRITELTAEAMGGSADAKFTRGYPVMSNSSEQTEFAAKVARDVAGECAEAPLVMGGEDFAYMLEERPGAYICWVTAIVRQFITLNIILTMMLYLLAAVG